MIFIDKNSNTGSLIYYKDEDNKGILTDEILGSFKPKTTQITTTSSEVQELLDKKGYQVSRLPEMLGLTQNLSLYEVFSYYFEGKVQTDYDMVDTIFKGLIYDSDWCFCLKIGVTFCWFTITPTKLVKLGAMQFSETITNYTVGRFIKRLRYNIARTGVNLSKIKFLYWNEDDYDLEFSKYIFTFDYLYRFFNNIDGLHDMKASNIMRLLSHTIKPKYIVTAEAFVSCLSDSFQDLGLTQKDGVLYSTQTYYKDYNTCVSPIIDSSKCSYGMIFDTEGVKGSDGKMTNGVSELGGLIYCKYKNILLNVDTFECDSLLLSETLNRVVLNYRDITGTNRYKKIPVLVYGKSDILMLGNSSIPEKIYRVFDFIDCKKFIKQHCTEISDKPTLSNIAREFGVKPIYPKHRALNDSKTLFNILAKILQDSEEFVI